MKTKVADMLGVDYPILAFSHCRDVVAAVTNAGGFATYFVGQVAGQMNSTKKAGQVVLEMVQEYADVLERFASEAAAAS